jgi:hypothetical protein
VSSRPVTVLLGAAALLVVGVALLARNVPPRSPSPPAPRATPSPSRVQPEPPALDVARLRDVFEFAAARPDALPARARRSSTVRAEAPSAPPAPGPKLVGIVRRSGHLLAALALGGEVELAGPGESAAGVTVVAVGEDGVRVRSADGSEIELALPD